jgi:hypothetical protein
VPYAPQTALAYCLLETVFPLFRLTGYYARLNRHRGRTQNVRLLGVKPKN